MERGDNEGFESESGFDRGTIITARGTGDGLVIRLDGRADQTSIREAFLEFMTSRKRFVSGNDVSLEWVGTVPESTFVDELSTVAQDQFDITVRSSSLRESKPLYSASATSSATNPASIEGLRNPEVSPIRESRGSSAKLRTGEALDLFGGVDSFPFEDEVRRTLKAGAEAPRAPFDSSTWDNADARILFSTVRSGQKIETEHSLIIVGDVNSGGELVAGGDIIVLGTLRGVAHAGAYDETGGGRIIFALNLQPTQLRIGMTISRGQAADSHSKQRSSEQRISEQRGSEIARVDGGMIVVEPYQARGTLNRRRDQ